MKAHFGTKYTRNYFWVKMWENSGAVECRLIIILSYSAGWAFKNICQWWLVWSVFSCILWSVMAIPHIVDVTSGTKILLISFHFALLDHECSRTHANDDQWGLYFPWFYAVAAIRHIVDVTSGKSSSFHFILLFWMSVQEHMPMMTGAVCIFLDFMLSRHELATLHLCFPSSYYCTSFFIPYWILVCLPYR